MDYKKCVILPPSPQRKIPSPNHFFCDNEINAGVQSRYQYELKPDVFDPFGTSPPQLFMLKLKERLGMHSSENQYKDGLKIKDLMRKSE